MPHRDLRAYVPMLEAWSKPKAHIQTTLPFPEAQSHNVLVRNWQATPQHFADIIKYIVLLNYKNHNNINYHN